MAHVNLLPWRETAKARAKQQFGVAAGIAAGIAGLLLVGAYLTISDMTQKQRNRNTFMHSQIQVLDAQIAEISEINKQKEQIVNRMKLIQSLHTDRNTAIRIFNELASRTPDGIFLLSANKNGTTLILQGRSVSNNQVAEFLRLLKESPIFRQPDLRQVVSDRQSGANGEQISAFTIVVQVQVENPSNEGAKP